MSKQTGPQEPVLDWHQAIWDWSPETGQWTPDHGLPAQCVYLALATPANPHPDNYDYWRQTVFYDFAADAPRADQRRRFQARAAGLVGPDGSLFWYQSHRLGGRRDIAHCRRGDYDDLTIGLVLKGRRHHQLADGDALVAAPGELFLYDPTRPCRINWSDHGGVHLTLPRHSLAPLFDLDSLSLPELLARLKASPMTGFLNNHLRQLATSGDRLPPGHRALLLNQTRELALAALGSAFHLPAEEHAPDATYLSAQKLIQQHLNNPDLDPAGLARALGCSRATLYRLFSRHGTTVAGCLREARLTKAYRLLTTAPSHLGIAELAAQCGFLDNAGFSRLFRRRFGLRPSDLR